MVASCGDSGVGWLITAFAFLDRIEINVVCSAVMLVGYFAVGNEGGGDSRVVDTSIGPLCVPRIILDTWAQFQLPRYSQKRIRRTWWNWPRGIRITQVTCERFHFG